MAKSELEQEFEFQLKLFEFPKWEREYMFAKEELGRRWRLDFAWPDYKIGVEIEGGIWTGGRHVRGKGFTSLCEKTNAGCLLGWSFLHITSKHISDGDAIEWLDQLYKNRADMAWSLVCALRDEPTKP